MTTLSPVLLSVEEKERLIDQLRREHSIAALNTAPKGSPCPHGGKCECPKTKDALIQKEVIPLFHVCQPEVRCVVLRLLCPNGTYSS